MEDHEITISKRLLYDMVQTTEKCIEMVQEHEHRLEGVQTQLNTCHQLIQLLLSYDLNKLDKCDNSGNFGKLPQDTTPTEAMKAKRYGAL